MHNPLFDLFGGRGYFYSILGVALVILWQVTGWDAEMLKYAIGLLGAGVVKNGIEDGLEGLGKKTVEYVDSTTVIQE